MDLNNSNQNSSYAIAVCSAMHTGAYVGRDFKKRALLNR